VAGLLRWRPSPGCSRSSTLRSANTTLFESFDEKVLDRVGEASGRLFTVRALLYIIAGHEAHHMGVLREKYLA
jgi:hypothetical protein